MQIAAKKKVVITCSLAVCAAMVLGCVLPALAPPSRCGGNSAALNKCRNYGLVVRMQAEESGGSFDPSALSDWAHTDMKHLADNRWIGNATILVRKARLKPQQGSKTIIAVCDMAFDNVPQPTIWNLYRRTPAHAVTYSDGSAGLISPVEFGRLDLSGFAPAQDLVIASVLAPPPTDTK
jgi:hypothetical protein